jgi:hypothetical protein
MDQHSTIPHIYSMWGGAARAASGGLRSRDSGQCSGMSGGRFGDEVNLNPTTPPDPTPEAIIVQGLQSTFMSAVGDIITSRIALNSTRAALKDQLTQVIAAHDDMITAFQNDAVNQYPELQNYSANQIYQLLQTLSPDHPLWAIFQPYASGLADAENQIASLAVQYSDNYTQEQDLAYKENQMCVSYDNYLDSNGLTQYPHSADILPSLPDPQEINAQVDIGTFTQLSMLDLVNIDVEDVVVKVLAAQDGGTVSPSCVNLPTSSDTVFDATPCDYQAQDSQAIAPSPSVTSQAVAYAAPAQTVDDGSGNQVATSIVDAAGLPQPQAMLSSQNLNADGSPATDSIHPAYLALALAALAYVLLGS